MKYIDTYTFSNCKVNSISETWITNYDFFLLKTNSMRQFYISLDKVGQKSLGNRNIDQSKAIWSKELFKHLLLSENPATKDLSKVKLVQDTVVVFTIFTIL